MQLVFFRTGLSQTEIALVAVFSTESCSVRSAAVIRRRMSVNTKDLLIKKYMVHHKWLQ